MVQYCGQARSVGCAELPLVTKGDCLERICILFVACCSVLQGVAEPAEVLRQDYHCPSHHALLEANFTHVPALQAPYPRTVFAMSVCCCNVQCCGRRTGARPPRASGNGRKLQRSREGTAATVMTALQRMTSTGRGASSEPEPARCMAEIRTFLKR